VAGHIHLAVQLLALPGVGLAGGRHHHGTGRELLQLRQSEAGYVSLKAGRVRVVVTVDLVTDGVDVDSTNDLQPGPRQEFSRQLNRPVHPAYPREQLQHSDFFHLL